VKYNCYAKTANIVVKETGQFKHSVKDGKYDARKTANIKNFRPRNLAKWAFTYYSGSIYS
jgi:hypothetical protein